MKSVVLLEQLWVIDDTKSRVKQVIEKAGKELGAPVKITGFVRFALGEGIDKRASGRGLIASGRESDWHRWEIGGW